MALLQTCVYARITHTLRLAYATHQVRRLMTGVRTSPSGLLDDWRATHAKRRLASPGAYYVLPSPCNLQSQALRLGLPL